MRLEVYRARSRYIADYPSHPSDIFIELFGSLFLCHCGDKIMYRCAVELGMYLYYFYQLARRAERQNKGPLSLCGNRRMAKSMILGPAKDWKQ